MPRKRKQRRGKPLPKVKPRLPARKKAVKPAPRTIKRSSKPPGPPEPLKFRPRKSDLGRVVLLSASERTKTRRVQKGRRKITERYKVKPGERVKPSYKGKVWAYYVGKRGKVQLYRDWGKKVRPVKTRSIDPTAFKGEQAREAAKQEFHAILSKLTGPLTVKPRRGRKRVDWFTDVAPKLAEMLLVASRLNRGSQTMVVKSAVVVKRGEEAVVMPEQGSMDVPLKLAGNQQEGLDKGYFEGWIKQKLYAFIAESLRTREWVSSGSAAYISELPQNEGLDREEWTDGKGERWEKNDWEEVEITRADFEFFMVQIRG